MKKYFLFLVFISTCLQSVYSQITTNELPFSIQRGLNLLSNKKAKRVVELPVPDIKKALHEDSLYREKKPDGFLRTAIPIPVNIDMETDGIWTSLDDGSKIWQTEIRAEKALAIDFVFSKFWLPKGGKFFIFNPSTKETIGAITSQYLAGEKKNPHRFSTAIVKGDHVILEYFQPAGEKELPVVVTEKVYYSYRNFRENVCSSEVNVNCSEGNNWQFEKDAVALVHCKWDTGSGYCSGFLVNNTMNNLTPYFITADHCLGEGVGKKDAITDNDLSDWVFYWGYEQPTCSDSIQYGFTQTTTGAILKANNSYTDFALLQLQQDPLNLTMGTPYYLGWDVSGSSGIGGVCIHHPKEVVKKISTYSCTPQTISFNSFPAVFWGVQWIETINGHGITEKGSSGSPLINNNHRVIGQLSGGNASCTDLTGTSAYGKLSISWTGNNNSDNRRRLDYWLNPNGLNVQFIDGKSPINLSGPSLVCGSEVYSIQHMPLFTTITWSINNSAFILTPSGNSCTVVYNGATPTNTITATLTATISKNGNTLKTLTKTIYVHGTNLNIEGSQVTSSPSGQLGLNEFSINTSTATFNQIDADSIEIIGGLEVSLASERFRGMDISFSGPALPTQVQHTDNMVIFTPQESCSYYDLTLVAESDDGCSDFSVEFPVVIDENAQFSSFSLSVSMDQSTLYLTLLDAIGTPFQQGTWSFVIKNAITGVQVHSQQVYGTSATVNISGYASGLYIVNATYKGARYSKKFVKN